MAAAAGVALALALPGAGIAPLVLAFPGLLLEAVRRAPSPRAAAAAACAGGVVHWCLATAWVVPVMRRYGGLPLAAAAGCLLGMAALLAAVWAVAGWLVRRVGPGAGPAVLAAWWVLGEALREGPLYRFPWNPVAAVLADHPRLLGSLPVWGTSGLGWALVAAGGGAWGLLRRGTRRAGAATLAAAAALTAAATALAPPPVCGPPVRAALVQPETSMETSWTPGGARALLERVEAATRRAAAGGAELVLWPESAVPGSLERDPSLDAWVAHLARETGVTVVLESIGWNREGRPTNAAFVVTPEGRRPERYDKVRLVPFGEYVPWWARWGFAEGLVREVGSFAPGRDARPLPTPAGPAGIAICYEIAFPGHVARTVRGGAAFLVTLTNDGWYGRSWAPRQHFAQAVLRAVETRRWVLRAALTGISGAVAPDGRVAARLGTGATGVLLVTAARCTGETPRVRFGDWWRWAALAILAGAFLAPGRRGRGRVSGAAGHLDPEP